MLHKGGLRVNQQLVEFDFLEFFLFDHQLDSLLFQLLSEALIFLFKVVFHFLLLSGQQLVDFKLAVEFLLKVFNNKFNLSDFVAELIVFNFDFGQLPLMFSVSLLLLLHFLFILVILLFELQ